MNNSSEMILLKEREEVLRNTENVKFNNLNELVPPTFQQHLIVQQLIEQFDQHKFYFEFFGSDAVLVYDMEGDVALIKYDISKNDINLHQHIKPRRLDSIGDGGLYV